MLRVVKLKRSTELTRDRPGSTVVLDLKRDRCFVMIQAMLTILPSFNTGGENTGVI